MTETGWILASVIGTTLVILLSLIAFAAVSTMLEVRNTARRLRELIERIGPDAEATAQNLRDVSDAAARGTHAIQRLGERIGSQFGPMSRPSGGSSGLWAMAATALLALVSAWRRRRASRRNAR